MVVIKAESRTVLVVRCKDFLVASYGEEFALDSDPQLLRLSLEPQLFLWLSKGSRKAGDIHSTVAS